MLMAKFQQAADLVVGQLLVGQLFSDNGFDPGLL